MQILPPKKRTRLQEYKLHPAIEQKAATDAIRNAPLFPQPTSEVPARQAEVGERVEVGDHEALASLY